jgi:ribosomal protein S27E
MKFSFLLIFPLFACQLLLGQTIIYVDKDASEGGDGTSWSSAYKFLNDALDYVDNRSGRYDLWVAEGTYYTDEGNLYANDDQNSTYLVPSTVDSILGGFSGTETSADQADSTKYLTTLSGYIFEEYGVSGLGTSRLIQTEYTTFINQLTFKDLTIVNSSDQEGSVIYITDQTDRLQTVFINCRFPNCESTNTVFSTPSSQTVSFLQCHFTNCTSSGNYLIKYGSFTSCYFNRNESSYSMLYEASTIDRCFVSECVMTGGHSGNAYQLISGSTDILSSLFYRNISQQHIIAASYQNQILHNTFVDNYTRSYSADIYGSSFTLGYCLFFRSGFNDGPMVSDLTVGYKSTVKLPVQSAFFGIFDYWSGGSYGGGTDINGWYLTFNSIYDVSPFAGTSIFENNFLKNYEADLSWSDVYLSLTLLNGQPLSEFFDSYETMYGFTIRGYTPEFTKVLQSEQIPDPFIDSDDPLGPDGIPFTEDDGLQLDPDSQWASEVINVPTITADFETYDLLGNPRIVGNQTDLGAYEYAPIQDADSDGISDANDDFPNDPSETLDTDDDGLGDNQDSDDDGDGVDDAVEIASGTDPKQYNSALYNFVQSLGSGSYDADDIAESRSAGQSDVTSEPNLFSLYTLTQVSSANAAGRTQGQNDVTTDPNSFSLYSAEDYNLAQSNSRSLGQQDVVTNPLSYGLYSPSYVISLLDSSRTVGQSDVTGDPSSYGLYSEQGITDLRPGSTILQLGPNNSATLELQIERSNDLSNWTTNTDDLVEVEIPLNGDTEFFRFKMTE